MKTKTDKLLENVNRETMQGIFSDDGLYYFIKVPAENIVHAYRLEVQWVPPTIGKYEHIKLKPPYHCQIAGIFTCDDGKDYPSEQYGFLPVYNKKTGELSKWFFQDKTKYTGEFNNECE